MEAGLWFPNEIWLSIRGLQEEGEEVVVGLAISFTCQLDSTGTSSYRQQLLPLRLFSLCLPFWGSVTLSHRVRPTESRSSRSQWWFRFLFLSSDISYPSLKLIFFFVRGGNKIFLCSPPPTSPHLSISSEKNTCDFQLAFKGRHTGQQRRIEPADIYFWCTHDLVKDGEFVCGRAREEEESWKKNPIELEIE